MDTTLIRHTPTALSYWALLKNLSSDVKADLITLLASSLSFPKNENKTKDQHWADEFCGTWQDDRSTQEIINDIRESRLNGTRDIASFD